MKKPTPAVAVVALIALLTVVGCGSSSDSSSPGGAYGGGESTSTTASKSGDVGRAVVTGTKVPGLGLILVEGKGYTVYDFHKDKGTKSACYGQCAQVWPPVITEGPTRPGEWVEPAKFGTSKRSDGTVQVTYAGHPLYTYTADTKPGDAKGNDFSSFGAQWYALQPDGKEAGD